MILITAIFFIFAAVDSYNYDMDPANGVDIMEGFGAIFTLIIGGFVVLYELDLFYTTYYFFIKPKTKAKSILNVASNLTLLSIAFSDSIAHFLYRYVSKAFGEEVIVLLALILTYITLRIVCAAIPAKELVKESKF